MNAFEALGLSQPVVEAVEALGYTEPTPIQQQAIPRLVKEEIDFIGLAQTGTGKTAAFGLPLAELIDDALPLAQALVLAPTRELCLQITNELEQFARFRKKLNILAVYGGADIRRQIQEAKKGVHILVATPGRLRDLMRRRAVTLEHLKYVVLDEADEMLNMGFKEEIDEILEATPKDRQTWLFSATMPEGVRRISKDYMNTPFELSVGQKNTGNQDIDHQYTILRPAARYEALRRFLDYDGQAFALVFCRTRRDASELAEKLIKDGYQSDSLHGDLSQAQRDRVMERFRSRQLKVLVATDVAARGLDVDNISHVFHFNIPDDINFYTHRSGRTGRAGRKGISLVLTHPKDRQVIRRLEQRLKVAFTPVQVPSGQEVFEKRLHAFFQRIKNADTHEAIAPLLPALIKEVEGLSREELLHKIASMTMRRSMNSHLESKELNVKERGARSRPGRYKELFINIGTVDVEGKAGFLAFICGKSQVPGSSIGKIDMKDKHTFFQVEEEVAARIAESLDGKSHNGRSLRVNSGNITDNNRKNRPKKGKKKLKHSRR